MGGHKSGCYVEKGTTDEAKQSRYKDYAGVEKRSRDVLKECRRKRCAKSRLARHPSCCSARLQEATTLATSPARRPTTRYGTGFPLALQYHLCRSSEMSQAGTPHLRNASIISSTETPRPVPRLYDA
ncbi:hypothetical protein E2C01_006402 [Portunus trituberculatus]|uniref:Uncharacterized protein n=1 Tax=Portunus trituberculatus TaxID=210409 RepID=A0A5B7CW97_PORTR|nr:hypothetical protein [Portunus trituberculatus]